MGNNEYSIEQLDNLDSALKALDTVREKNKEKGYTKDFSGDSPQMVEYIKKISKQVMDEDLKNAII